MSRKRVESFFVPMLNLQCSSLLLLVERAAREERKNNYSLMISSALKSAQSIFM
jgi:hypothetical protein